jgi:hypothetical protein
MNKKTTHIICGNGNDDASENLNFRRKGKVALVDI